MSFRRLLPLLAAVAVLAAGCATRPPADDPEALAEFRQNNDPLEPTNRALYAAHAVLDRYTLRPAAQVYQAVVPAPVRGGVRNALGNLRGPTVLMNDLLQGNVNRASVTMARFMVNSTLGLGGIFDVARDRFDMPGHAEDFGQTLAVWGLGEGPYIFVPLLGPSNPRDLLGTGVDLVASPWFWLGQGEVVQALRWARFGMTVLDTRESLLDTIDQLERTSLDPYSAIRSAYRQRRNAEIANQDLSGPAARPSGFGVGTTPTPPRER